MPNIPTQRVIKEKKRSNNPNVMCNVTYGLPDISIFFIYTILINPLRV